MSFLSNFEIRELYNKGTTLVEGLHPSEFHELANGSLEAASIKLKVGEIYQHDENSSSGESALTIPYVDLEQGDMAFVLTEEKVVLPPDIGALMFSKSGGLAERGILITNTGHIDPGYSGNLRYAVVNMGNSRFHLRKGDPLVKVMFFRMYRPASPHWGELHPPSEPPTFRQIADLGKSLAAIHSKVEQQAASVAKEEFLKQGLHTLLWTTAAATIIAILATIVTFNFGLAPMIERQIHFELDQIKKLPSSTGN